MHDETRGEDTGERTQDITAGEEEGSKDRISTRRVRTSGTNAQRWGRGHKVDSYWEYDRTHTNDA